MRRDKERLQDILEAIAAIDRYSQKGEKVFEEQELIQVWILHHLQIIGEAANAVSDDLTAIYPEIPWQQIVALRNFVVHEYFRVDLQVVWGIIQEDLTPLRVGVEKILKDSGY